MFVTRQGKNLQQHLTSSKLRDPNFKPEYTNDDWTKARRAYRSACRKSRYEFWKESLNGATKPKQVAALHRSLKGKLAPEPGLFKNGNVDDFRFVFVRFYESHIFLSLPK